MVNRTIQWQRINRSMRLSESGDYIFVVFNDNDNISLDVHKYIRDYKGKKIEGPNGIFCTERKTFEHFANMREVTSFAETLANMPDGLYPDEFYCERRKI